MSNVYEMFRKIQQNKKTCYDNRSAAFILEGKISQDIYHKRRKKDIKAALVFNHQEGPDDVITFSLKDDDLIKTDYFVFDNVNYLVYEDVKQTHKDLSHKKQRAVECNISFTYKNKLYYGYFTSSLRRTSDPDFQGRQGLVPDENPLLILPTNEEIDINSTFSIEGKPWKVVEYDHITNKGISYIYLERHFTSNAPAEEEVVEIEYVNNSEPIVQPDPDSDPTAAEELSLRPMVEYTFTTQNAYFASTPRVEILSRSKGEVKFRVPYGISFVTISTRQNGDVVENGYSVVM